LARAAPASSFARNGDLGAPLDSSLQGVSYVSAQATDATRNGDDVIDANELIHLSKQTSS
jgi:hypothetical protein